MCLAVTASSNPEEEERRIAICGVHGVEKARDNVHSIRVAPLISAWKNPYPNVRRWLHVCCLLGHPKGPLAGVTVPCLPNDR